MFIAPWRQRGILKLVLTILCVVTNVYPFGFQGSGRIYNQHRHHQTPRYSQSILNGSSKGRKCILNIEAYCHTYKKEVTRLFECQDGNTCQDGAISKSKQQMKQGIPSTVTSSETSQRFYPFKKFPLNILLIDNYDSYTYNLYQYLSEIVEKVIVIQNDVCTSWEQVKDHMQRCYGWRTIDGIVLSPGPGRPDIDRDVGVCKEVITANSNIPILGVCLGHQLLAHLNEAEVTHAKRPMHGRLSQIRIIEQKAPSCNSDATNVKTFLEDKMADRGGSTNCRSSNTMHYLFNGIETDFCATRYHSLSVKLIREEKLWAKPNRMSSDENWNGWSDAEVIPLAYSLDDGEIMALSIRDRPHHVGVQFHPESVGTMEGKKILANWVEFCHNQKIDRHMSRSGNRFGLKRGITAYLKGLVKAKFNDAEDKRAVNHPYKVDKSHRSRRIGGITSIGSAAGSESSTDMQSIKQVGPYDILIHHIKDCAVDPAMVFEEVYGNCPTSFWLDSSSGPKPWMKDFDASSLRNFDPNARFSIMGNDDGPLSHIVEYYRSSDSNRVERKIRVLRKVGGVDKVLETFTNVDILTFLKSSLFGCQLHNSSVRNGRQSFRYKVVDDTLVRCCATNDKFPDVITSANGRENDDLQQLPFSYRGGYVGFIGYEVRHDTFAQLSGKNEPRRDIGSLDDPNSDETCEQNVPDAAFIFADRSVLFDHFSGDVFLIGYVSRDGEIKSRERQLSGRDSTECCLLSWMRLVSDRLRDIKNRADSVGCGDEAFTVHNDCSQQNRRCQSPASSVLDSSLFRPRRSKVEYEADISQCHVEIRNGESYEVCLTNQFELDTGKLFHETSGREVHVDEVYNELRKSNAAPFAAFLRFDPNGRLSKKQSRSTGESSFTIPLVKRGDYSNMRASVALCCSSPERFLSLSSGGVLESKPIKGTCRRGANRGEDTALSLSLERSEKNQAENLMIVDLVRNDFGRLCEVDTVCVPKLCDVESYATVHQLVSTVRGLLPKQCGFTKNGTVVDYGESVSVIDAIISCFPGGSMTGAPKVRTMQILENLENYQKRGPYAGCIGYISPNNAMDMNIVIRTAVISPSDTSTNTLGTKIAIGAGGAITALSDREDEDHEMVLKSKVVVNAVLNAMNRIPSDRQSENLVENSILEKK